MACSAERFGGWDENAPIRAEIGNRLAATPGGVARGVIDRLCVIVSRVYFVILSPCRSQASNRHGPQPFAVVVFRYLFQGQALQLYDGITQLDGSSRRLLKSPML